MFQRLKITCDPDGHICAGFHFLCSTMKNLWYICCAKDYKLQDDAARASLFIHFSCKRRIFGGRCKTFLAHLITIYYIWINPLHVRETTIGSNHSARDQSEPAKIIDDDIWSDLEIFCPSVHAHLPNKSQYTAPSLIPRITCRQRAFHSNESSSSPPVLQLDNLLFNSATHSE